MEIHKGYNIMDLYEIREAGVLVGFSHADSGDLIDQSSDEWTEFVFQNKGCLNLYYAERDGNDIIYSMGLTKTNEPIFKGSQEYINHTTALTEL